MSLALHPPHTHRLRRGAALLALAGLALAWTAPVGRADTCSACPEPTLADLQQEPGFELKTRSDDDGASHEDYLVTDGGACAYALAAPPTVTIGKTWTVLRGAGSVWNCPWGDTSATVTITVSDGDSTEWKIEGQVSAEVSLLVAKLGGSLGLSGGAGQVHGEVRTLSQELRAAPGHVLDWHGFFELADMTLDAKVAVTRRFAWWTKNEATDHVVHLKGAVVMTCGTEDLRMRRQASIGGLFRIWDGRCDAAVPPVDLGTFPRPQPVPVITPPDGTPVPGGETAGPDGELPLPLPQPPLPPLTPPTPPGPHQPDEPYRPVDPSEPSNPGNPGNPVGPRRAADPDEPWGPVMPFDPARPQEPGPRSGPEESADLPDPPAGIGPWPPLGRPDAESWQVGPTSPAVAR